MSAQNKNCTPWQTDLFNQQNTWLLKWDLEQPSLVKHVVSIYGSIYSNLKDYKTKNTHWHRVCNKKMAAALISAVLLTKSYSGELGWWHTSSAKMSEFIACTVYILTPGNNTAYHVIVQSTLTTKVFISEANLGSAHCMQKCHLVHK